MPHSSYSFWNSRATRKYIDGHLWHRSQSDLIAPRRGGSSTVRRLDRHDAPASEPHSIPAFAEIFSVNNLGLVAEELVLTGPDKAPGPDHVRFGKLSVSERWQICRQLNAELLAGNYEPSTRRIVHRRKPDGGTRPLSIRSIVHRIVTTAIYRALRPVIESIYVPHSYGFRTGHSVWHMLHALRRDVQTHGTIVAINDIYKAFDHIPINLAKEDINRHITDERLKAAIEQCLRGNPRDIREQADIGADQGSTLSPLILNLLLTHHLDLPPGASDPVVHRYADNLCIVASTVNQGLDRMHHVAARLGEIGMKLKHPITAIDLATTCNNAPSELLGYTLRLNPEGGRLMFGLGRGSWESLENSLTEAYNRENPAEYARAATIGWANACGPILETERYDRIISGTLERATQTGFREIAPEPIRRALQRSYGRWRNIGDANRSP